MGHPANMYEVPAPKPINVVPQHVQVASPPASFPETEAVNTESISSSQSFHIPSISRYSKTPTTSKHINSPTLNPEDSSGRAAELLLFLSGQEPNNNPQVLWRFGWSLLLYNQLRPYNEETFLCELDTILIWCIAEDFSFYSRNKVNKGIITNDTLQVFTCHHSSLCGELLTAALRRTSNSRANKGGRHTLAKSWNPLQQCEGGGHCTNIPQSWTPTSANTQQQRHLHLCCSLRC